MTTVGLIGSGNIGQAVAGLAILAGYDVVLSNSRGPESLADLVASLGDRARADTAEGAAAAGDLVVVTVPFRAYDQIAAGPLAGKIVIDTNNYSPDRDGPNTVLDDGSERSSVLVQRHLADSKVIKTFNTIYSGALTALARPRDGGDRSALPLFGDDLAAKTGVTEFLDTIGYDAVDGGSLADSWRAEPGTPVYGAPYAAGGNYQAFQPADRFAIRALLDQAER